ncbi:hypothetical protein ZYGR_0AG02780 [Zygosaccharomyces rouxii]|uniref:Uncharacterized protein n=1 Tax=Zygosaccharomyces rouxii TaxID=4956 RepID=A0A1Q3A9A7_ZYGRO|nr:hypothetical protein ZYGR_0AG02780 [Zygosaccharomyces rouxii]
MFNKVGRAYYSTGVTQEFLQNILARAQEATARKTDSAANPARRRRDNVKKANRRSKPVSPRVKPAASPNVINKQPQFKRKNGAAMKGQSEGVDLIDVMSDSKPRPSKKSGFRQSKREIPGMGKSTMVKGEGKLFVPKPAVQKEYAPQEPTPLSLMRFRPDIPVTPASRMINYSLDALKSANYPLNRFPNYGFYDNAQGSPKHIAISLHTPNFGSYQPDQGLVFEREKFISELAIECEPSKLGAQVSGKYQILKQHNMEDFKTIAKSEKKREELVKNAEVVRKSLESNPLDPAVKELLYDVCSGLKPISDLSQ